MALRLLPDAAAAVAASAGNAEMVLRPRPYEKAGTAEIGLQICWAGMADPDAAAAVAASAGNAEMVLRPRPYEKAGIAAIGLQISWAGMAVAGATEVALPPRHLRVPLAQDDKELQCHVQVDPEVWRYHQQGDRSLVQHLE